MNAKHYIRKPSMYASHQQRITMLHVCCVVFQQCEVVLAFVRLCEGRDFNYHYQIPLSLIVVSSVFAFGQNAIQSKHCVMLSLFCTPPEEDTAPVL